MKIKAIYFFEKEVEIIQYKNKNENTEKYNIEKKKFVMNLIKNSIDDKHEEINKSMDLSLDDIGGKDIYRDNSDLLFDEDEDENVNENNEREFYDVSEDDKRKDEDNKIKNKKKKNEKGKIQKKSRKKNKK